MSSHVRYAWPPPHPPFQGIFTAELFEIVKSCVVILPVLWGHEVFHGRGFILHSLDLVACLILSCSVNRAEWIHGRREKLFHYSITLSLWSWICQLHWANNTNKPCWGLTKRWSSEGHKYLLPCPLVIPWSWRRVRSGTRWTLLPRYMSQGQLHHFHPPPISSGSSS